MKNNRTRAWRRHKNFIKAKRQKHLETFHALFDDEKKNIPLGYYTKQHAFDCGNPRCGICGNPRKSLSYKGTKKAKKTIQELKFEQYEDFTD